MEFTLGKVCERCDAPIPDDYGNLLCDEHYATLQEERKKHQEAIDEEQKAKILNDPESVVNPSKIEDVVPALETPVEGKQVPIPVVVDPDTGITDPNYKENPEADDKDQILANLAQFIYTHRDADHPKGKKCGILLYYPTRNMYNFIKNYCMKKAMSHPQYPKYLWKPKIVDVGCGSGVGSNIMSQEADFVWGIDKNDFSIEFAKEAFTREKNGEYYSGQLTFDVIDLFNDTRQFMAFDIVTAIEVVEHIKDINGFLNQLKRFTKRDKKGKPMDTEFFISTPNRAHHKLRADHPENPFHVREWLAWEFTTLLRRHFQNVELLNQKGESIPEYNDVDEVILAKCSVPI